MPWTTHYKPIERDDREFGFIDESLRMNEAADRRMRGSSMSAEWFRGRSKKSSAEGVVFELMRIRETIRNLLKIHGVPNGTRIDIATMAAGARGAAGFDRISDFSGPHLVLDKTIYEVCESNEMLDVYCGAAIHEAEHLNETRLMFNLMESGELRGVLQLFYNLWEDERIEATGRERSPGYAPYLQACKRALFEKKEFGSAIDNWKNLPDKDKILAIIFGFVRTPYRLTDAQREWTTIAGECPFTILRNEFAEFPKDENAVHDYAKRTFNIFNELCDAYDGKDESMAEDLAKALKEMMGDDDDSTETEETDGGSGSCGSGENDGDEPAGGTGSAEGFGDETETGEGGSGGAGGSDSDDGTEADGTGDDSDDAEGTSETGESKTETEVTDKEVREMAKRLKRQAKADAADKKLEELDSKSDKKIDAAESKMKKVDTPEKMEHAMKSGKSTAPTASASRETAKRAKDNRGEKRIGERFGVSDLKRMIERLDSVSTPLDCSESECLAKAESERVEFGESWVNPDGYADDKRRTVISHPVATDVGNKRRYDAAKKAVKEHVQKMKQVFQFRKGTRHFTETQKIEGRLSRRMIGSAKATKRIFQTHYKKTAKGLSLCLVLDESGSMGTADVYGGELSTTRAGIALRVATLIVEALRNVDGIELEVYSYGSCGTNHADNHMKYLYGRENADPTSIGGYHHSGQNYDHQAIAEAGRLFKKNTENENRLMIVLSDGAPCGHGYGGMEAIRATKKSVDDLERQGVKVVQVAIDSFDSKSMFKNVIKFLDLNDLINNMRRLVTRVVQSIS